MPILQPKAPPTSTSLSHQHHAITAPYPPVGPPVVSPFLSHHKPTFTITLPSPIFPFSSLSSCQFDKQQPSLLSLAPRSTHLYHQTTITSRTKLPFSLSHHKPHTSPNVEKSRKELWDWSLLKLKSIHKSPIIEIRKGEEHHFMRSKAQEKSS